MHPVEHLYYFSCCCVPSLYFRMSPVVFLFNGFHLLLAAANGHSGYELQGLGDQAHYLHHKNFECNYGVPSTIPMDIWFGTYREKSGESAQYKGAAVDKPETSERQVRL